MKSMKIICILASCMGLATGITGCGDSSPSDPSEHSDQNAIVFNAEIPHSLPGFQSSRADTKPFSTESLSEVMVNGYLDKKVYMENVLLKKNGSVWEYSPLRYWPIDKSLNFFAYAPLNMVGSGEAMKSR